MLTIAAPAALADGELMGDVSAGSVDALAELHRRFGARAHRVALSVCHDEGRAQEAVQEAFLSIWKTRTSYRPHRGSVTAWLLTVVRYRAIDLARHNGQHASRRAGEEQLATRLTPDVALATVIRNEEVDELRASLALLPVLQQQVITLAFYGELSHTEIAARLGLPAGTVKGRMRLGLTKLRADIAPPAA